VLHPLSAAVADTALGGPRDASPETHSFTYLQDDGTDGEVACARRGVLVWRGE
jgi:hypothetical protein